MKNDEKILNNKNKKKLEKIVLTSSIQYHVRLGIRN
jgi:hypothetical protein